MSVSTVTLRTRFGAYFAKEDDADNSADTIKASSGTIYTVEINNSNNSANSYIRFFDHASPTVGSTIPEMVLKCPASTTVTYQFVLGVAFGTAITIAGLTVGGTSGTTSPTNNVIVKVVYD